MSLAFNKQLLFLGMEIDFDCTERRPGQWNVRLELPVDTPSGKAVVAEASLTGKKKDAMNNCALEACRLLDKYGMFKQSGWYYWIHVWQYTQSLQ